MHRLRSLRQRIQTSAPSLSPAFTENGLHAFGIWDQKKRLLGWTAEELREESEHIRLWYEIQLALRVLTREIAATNLKQKRSREAATEDEPERPQQS